MRFNLGLRIFTSRRWTVLAALAGLVSLAGAAKGADVVECRALFLSGQYSNCIQTAEEAIRNRERGEEWPLLLTEALNTVGRFAEAQAAISNGVRRYVASTRLRFLAYQTYLKSGQRERASAALDDINEMGSSRGWGYQDAANLVALGRAALLLGGEPRRVLELFFDRARKADPDVRDSYLAIGDLALDKEDYEMASKAFTDGLKQFPDDPDFHFGLARSFASADRERMVEEIDAALKGNPNHARAMLLMVDHLIDAEQYPPARKLLARVLAVNPAESEAWSYLFVLEHLKGDSSAELNAHGKALWPWADNPAVDHLIGKKLSQKYRFSEGAKYQRQSLESDTNYLPAKLQLAQDLLRLGKEQEGWALATAVYEKDAYNVGAYNLVTLHDNIAHFQTLTNDDFLIRMDPREARLYGKRVQALLDQAKTTLCRKYGWSISEPVLVEIFPDQKDFAVRTFGMPGGEGFLGVCFGPVITANSPASQAIRDANWQAILWHEFCHVVTLGLTKNQMPRWLSEGISVFEEKQGNRAWGQKMTPRYREMILGGELVPIHDLSAAFLAPKSDFHLQFAYFESAMVVEFLLDRFGLDAFKAILAELRKGGEITDALERSTHPLPELEKDFEAFARKAAEALGPGLDWTKPAGEKEGGGRRRYGVEKKAEPEVVKGPVVVQRPPRAFAPTSSAAPPGQSAKTNAPPAVAAAPEEAAKTSTNAAPVRPNFYHLMSEAKDLLSAKEWAKAKGPLQQLIDLYPEQVGNGSAYALLATVHQHLDETNLEKAVLSKLAELDAEAPEVYRRLMELSAAEKDWGSVAENARRFLAVNPLTPLPYRYLAEASEALAEKGPAMEAWEALLALEGSDSREAHYHLAALLKGDDVPRAKRHVLQALEEAPRFRDAQRLLLELNSGGRSNQTDAVKSSVE